QLRARPAILMSHRGNSRREPWAQWDVPPKSSQRGHPRKQPRRPRAHFDHLLHIARVVLPFPLKFSNRLPQNPSNHVPASHLQKQDGIPLPNVTLISCSPTLVGLTLKAPDFSPGSGAFKRRDTPCQPKWL